MCVMLRLHITFFFVINIIKKVTQMAMINANVTTFKFNNSLELFTVCCSRSFILQAQTLQSNTTTTTKLNGYTNEI